MATVTLRHPPTRPRLEVRGGPAYWVGGYRTMLRWQLASLRIWLPTLALVQVLAGAGMVLGIGLLFADIPRRRRCMSPPASRSSTWSWSGSSWARS